MFTSECTNCDGVNSIDPATGKNKWIPGPKSNQTYLLLHDGTAAGNAIDDLLCQPPKLPQHPADIFA